MFTTDQIKTTLDNLANVTINFNLNSNYWRLVTTQISLPAICLFGQGLNDLTGTCANCATGSSTNCDCGIINQCIVCNSNFNLRIHVKLHAQLVKSYLTI